MWVSVRSSALTRLILRIRTPGRQGRWSQRATQRGCWDYGLYYRTGWESHPGGMLIDNGVELLTEEECRALLFTESVGRGAVSGGALPAIFPVNYSVVDDDIVFLTGEGMKLQGALENTVVGFEVDSLDPA